MTRKLHRKEGVALQYDERFGAIECILFVSGDPVPVIQLQRALGLTDIEMQSTRQSRDELYRREERGIQLYLTEETVQLVSNRKYTDLVLTLLQPVQSRTFSQSMLETLSIIAYRQPVTRADIEAVRGVRCESQQQLLKLGMIRELGRKDVVGRPMLFGTTDAFLRHFGLRSISELPRYEAYAEAGSGAENTETVEQA